MSHRIVITRHRPWMRWLLVGVGSFAMAVGAWALYSYTRATTVTEFEQTQEDRQRLLGERRQLVRDLRAARSEAQELREQLVYLEQSQQIDREACIAVKDSLKGMQTELTDLQEQVAFYRGIVSPSESRAGVRVYELKVSPAGGRNEYRYDLVLIQSVRHDRRVSGSVEVTLQGARMGTTHAVHLRDAILGERRNLVFSFKYFQEFSGEFRLPDNFKPVRVTVSVVPDGANQPRVEDVFDWNKIQGT